MPGRYDFLLENERPSPTPGPTQGDGRYDFLLEDQPSATPTGTPAGVPSAPPLLTPPPVTSEKTSQALEDANRALAQLEGDERDKERQAAANLKPYGPEIPRIRPETFREQQLANIRSFLTVPRMGLERPAPMFSSEVTKPVMTGLAGLTAYSRGLSPLTPMLQSAAGSVSEQIEELSRPDTALGMLQQGMLSPVTVPTFMAERALSLPEQTHKIAEAYRNYGLRSPQMGQALAEEVPADLLALAGYKMAPKLALRPGERFMGMPEHRVSGGAIAPRGRVPAPGGWMYGQEGAGGFVMPGYPPPPLSPGFTYPGHMRYGPQPRASVGIPLEQQEAEMPGPAGFKTKPGPITFPKKEGGEEHAIKPSDAQMAGREAAQREQEGTGGPVTGPGRGDHVVGEEEGAAPGRELPSEKAPPVKEPKWVMEKVHGVWTVFNRDRPTELDYFSANKNKVLERLKLRRQQAGEEPPAPESFNKQPLSELLTPNKLAEHQSLVKQWARLNLEGQKYVNNPEHPRAWAIADHQRQIKNRLRAIQQNLPDGDVYDVIGIGSGATNTAGGMHAGLDHVNMLVLEHEGGRGVASGRTNRYENVTNAPSPLGVSGRRKALIDRLAAMRQGTEFKTVSGIADMVQDPETKIWTVTTTGLGPGGEGSEIFRARTLDIGTGTRPRGAPFELRDSSGKVLNPKGKPFVNQTGKAVHLDDADGMALEAAGGETAAIGGGNSVGQGVVGIGSTPGSGKVHIFFRHPELDMSGGLDDMVHVLVDDGKAVLHPSSNIDHVEAPPNPGGDYIVVTKEGERVPVKAVGSFIGGKPNTEILPKDWLRDEKGFLRTDEDLRVLRKDENGKEVPVEGVYAGGSVRSAPGVNRMGPSEGEGGRMIALANGYLTNLEKQGLMPAWKQEIARNRREHGAGAKPATPSGKRPPGEGPAGEDEYQFWKPGTEKWGEPRTPVIEGGKTKKLPPRPSPEIPGEIPEPPPLTTRQAEALELKNRKFRPAPPPSQPQEQQPGRAVPPPVPPAFVVPFRSEVPGKPEFPPPQKPAGPGEPIIEKASELAWVKGAAESRVRDNPRLPDQLVSGILDGERPGLDQVDSQVLLNKKAQLQDARDKAGRRLMDKSLSDGERNETLATFEDLDNEVRQIDRATDDGNLLTGQSQSKQWHTFRQRDYDENGMTQKMVAAKNGAALSKAEEADVKKKTDALATAMIDLEGVTRRTGFYPGKFKRGDPGYNDIRNAQQKAFDAKTALDDMVWKEKLRTAGKMAQATHVAHELIGVQRALMTSFDFSAVRRQGGIFFMGHPIRAIGEMPDMFRAAASNKQYFRLMQDLRERPNAELYRTSKLALTDVTSPNVTQMEEAYMSRWANAIPIVNNSQRAYVYFLNRMRADTFDAMASTLTRNGVPTAKQAEAISNFINVFTGRGHLGKDYANASAILNDVFFAPRYVLSRWQALTFQPLRHARDPAVRKLIAQEYARSLAGYAVVYGLANTALKEFVEVSGDPTSADFGKIKIKGTDTRIDFLSGLSQQIVFAAREGTLAYEQLEHQLRTGEPKRYPLTHRGPLAVAQDYLRTKYAPLPSMYFNSVEGKKVTGEPTTIGKEMWDSLHPISGQDIYDSMKTYGIPEGAALGLLSTFGDNVQTYGTRVSPGGGRQRKRRSRVH
jgi:thioredoxin reductase